MRVELRLGGLITVKGRDLALGKTHALLDGLARERSVSGAAARLGLSYRSAWGQVLALEEILGRPVAVKTKGHGSVLTDFGEALREALAATMAAFEQPLAEEGRGLERRLAALLSTSAARPTRIALSHDPLLLRSLSDLPDVVSIIAGSEDAIAQLCDAEVDAAGFHTGDNGPTSPPFDRLDRDPALSVVPLFTREQGLMVAAGNPLGIRSVADLARSGARFVNRQRGSGTRAWFDRILSEAGIAPSAIKGYEMEEFTHQAVAALIAAGAAEAGMGVRSLAERFGLGFVPIGQETYHLAGRSEVMVGLLDRLRPKLAALVPDFPGYALVPPQDAT